MATRGHRIYQLNSSQVRQLAGEEPSDGRADANRARSLLRRIGYKDPDGAEGPGAAPSANPGNTPPQPPATQPPSPTPGPGPGNQPAPGPSNGPSGNQPPAGGPPSQDPPDGTSTKKPGAKGSLLPTGLRLLGGILSKVGDAGEFHWYNNPLDPLTQEMNRVANKLELTDAYGGVGEEATELIDRLGAQNAPEWAKLQLLQRLISAREAAVNNGISSRPN